MDLSSRIDGRIPNADFLVAEIARAGSSHVATFKPWGVTLALLTQNEVQVDMLVIKQGGYCSLHKHLDKHNLFIVTAGTLKVTLFHHVGDRIEESAQHMLTADQGVLLVAAQTPHQFLCLDDCTAYEVYWPISDKPVERNDIQRYGENGILKDLLMVGQLCRSREFNAVG